MPQSLGKVLVHVVFSTKHRLPTVDDAVRGGMHAYLAGSVNGIACRAIRIGGTADHVHALASLGRTVSVAELVHVMKGGSSRWMSRGGHEGFAWQAGYAVFSIGQSQVGVVARYVARQKEHHRRRTFQDELRLLLNRYGVAYDERYIWD